MIASCVYSVHTPLHRNFYFGIASRHLLFTTLIPRFFFGIIQWLKRLWRELLHHRLACERKCFACLFRPDRYHALQKKSRLLSTWISKQGRVFPSSELQSWTYIFDIRLQRWCDDYFSRLRGARCQEINMIKRMRPLHRHTHLHILALPIPLPLWWTIISFMSLVSIHVLCFSFCSILIFDKDSVFTPQRGLWRTAGIRFSSSTFSPPFFLL